MSELAFATTAQDEPAFRMGPKAEARIALSDSAIRRALEAIVELSALEESLLFRVCCLSLLRGYAWISQAHLAELMRCSERSVRDATKAVCELGLITTTRTRDGLRYFPQWEALGLDPVSKLSRPANAAGA